jgi:hypothetical protein
LSRIVFGLLLADSGVVSNSVQESGAEERLLLQADNTVIVNRDTYAASYLQYYLLKYLACHPDAALYQPEATVDRAAAPGFPIVREPPPDKHAITIGPCDAIPDAVLTPEDKARLRAARPGSVLLKRIGGNVVLARSSSNPWDFACLRIFLDRCAGIRMYAPAGADDHRRTDGLVVAAALCQDGLLDRTLPAEHPLAANKLDPFRGCRRPREPHRDPLLPAG